MDDDYQLTAEDLEASYVPTPAEITAGCAAIRSAWNAAELRRRNVYVSAGVETPEVALRSQRLMSTVEG